MAAAAKAQKLIDENPAVVFSKSYCPYCRATKRTLDDLGAKYALVELDQEGMFFYIFYSLFTFFPFFVVLTNQRMVATSRRRC